MFGKKVSENHDDLRKIAYICGKVAIGASIETYSQT